MASNPPLSRARLGELSDYLDALCVLNERMQRHAAACAHIDHPDELNQRELVAYVTAIDAILRAADFTLEKLEGTE